MPWAVAAAPQAVLEVITEQPDILEHMPEPIMVMLPLPSALGTGAGIAVGVGVGLGVVGVGVLPPFCFPFP